MLIYAVYRMVPQFANFLICATFNFPMLVQENSRLENELLENAEKLGEYENLTNKLQRNLENVLAEKVNLFKSYFLIGSLLYVVYSKEQKQCHQNIFIRELLG